MEWEEKVLEMKFFLLLEYPQPTFGLGFSFLADLKLFFLF